MAAPLYLGSQLIFPLSDVTKFHSKCSCRCDDDYACKLAFLMELQLVSTHIFVFMLVFRRRVCPKVFVQNFRKRVRKFLVRSCFSETFRPKVFGFHVFKLNYLGFAI